MSQGTPTLALLSRAPSPAASPGGGRAEEGWWRFDALAGRMVELSARGPSAVLTGALALVREAQARGESVAWVQARPDGFFPPDAAEAGVDLAALPVVLAAGAQPAGRAASHLLRSGAFGLVVLDLGAEAELPLPLQTRLSGLAQRHGAALLCLTDKPADAPSLGSLVSLRVEVRREEAAGEGFSLALEALKDKRRGPGARHMEARRGPAGLR